jgi:hypothetical protein
MSSYENNTTYQDTQKSPENQDIFINASTYNNTSEVKQENNELIKPIPINIKVIKRPKSELTTMGNSSLTIKNVVKELKMPIMYNNYNYVNFTKNEIYLGQLNHLNEFKDKRKEININDFSFRKDKPCCSCTKTRCIKKYCECFANNKYCINCYCKNCMNKLEEIEQFQNNNTINIMENDNQNDKVTCTCTKSNCCKKYCECFKINKKCTSKCRCLNCLNMDSQYANILNNNNNLINDVIIKNNINSEENNNNILLNKSSELESFNDNYAIQRISVLINKFQTEINVEKISKEELNLLCKKRKHI